MCFQKTKNFYIWLLQVIVVSGPLSLVLWLSLRPKPPNCTIVEFNVPVPASHSTVTNGTDNLNGTTISFSLEINNPNKETSIYYNNINLTVRYGGEVIGETVISAFHQGKSMANQLKEKLKVNEKLWERTVLGRVSNGTAEFEVGLVTDLKYKTGGVKSKHHKLEVQGHVPVGSDGKISGKRKRVKLQRKWSLNRFLKD